MTRSYARPGAAVRPVPGPAPVPPLPVASRPEVAAPDCPLDGRNPRDDRPGRGRWIAGVATGLGLTALTVAAVALWADGAGGGPPWGVGSVGALAVDGVAGPGGEAGPPLSGVATTDEVVGEAPSGEAATGEASGLDADLVARFEEARAAAAAEGVELTITSGWRSAADQQRLVDQAVDRYGSVEEAHRWVLPPEVSAHVSGMAIDVGGTDGALWLGEHGAEFGLCRTYANEVWHFEPVVERGGWCPQAYPDASHGWD